MLWLALIHFIWRHVFFPGEINVSIFHLVEIIDLKIDFAISHGDLQEATQFRIIGGWDVIQYVFIKGLQLPGKNSRALYASLEHYVQLFELISISEALPK